MERNIKVAHARSRSKWKGTRERRFVLDPRLILRNILLLDKFAFVASRFLCDKEHGVASSMAF